MLFPLLFAFLQFPQPPPPLRTGTNTTITGQVIDNLSGVQKLEVSLDDGAYANVTFDAHGNFSLPTTFAVNGGADGAHVFNFRATDASGNVSMPLRCPSPWTRQLQR